MVGQRSSIGFSQLTSEYVPRRRTLLLLLLGSASGLPRSCTKTRTTRTPQQQHGAQPPGASPGYPPCALAPGAVSRWDGPFWKMSVDELTRRVAAVGGRVAIGFKDSGERGGVDDCGRVPSRRFHSEGGQSVFALPRSADYRGEFLHPWCYRCNRPLARRDYSQAPTNRQDLADPTTRFRPARRLPLAAVEDPSSCGTDKWVRIRLAEIIYQATCAGFSFGSGKTQMVSGVAEASFIISVAMVNIPQGQSGRIHPAPGIT
jgi:hypothetical protein